MIEILNIKQYVAQDISIPVSYKSTACQGQYGTLNHRNKIADVIILTYMK